MPRSKSNSSSPSRSQSPKRPAASSTSPISPPSSGSTSSQTTLRAPSSPPVSFSQPKASSPLASPPVMTVTSSTGSHGSEKADVAQPLPGTRSRGISTSTVGSGGRKRSASNASTGSEKAKSTTRLETGAGWGNEDIKIDVSLSSFRNRSRSASHSSVNLSPTQGPPSPSSAGRSLTPKLGLGSLEGGSSISGWWTPNHPRPEPRPWFTNLIHPSSQSQSSMSTPSSSNPNLLASTTEEGDKKENPLEMSWMRCRERVAQSTAAVLPIMQTAGDIAHEALYVGVDLLEFAPVPGLATAGKVLLNIWDALQLVDMNRLACLRLTERCADALLSVRQEIFDAGDQVAEELKAPLERLSSAFRTVQTLLEKQNNRPFLKRYLKRDEILREIQGCDQALGDALGNFGLSIQIRILKQVQAAEARRVADTKEILRVVRENAQRPGGNALGLDSLSAELIDSLDELQLTDLPNVARDAPPPEYERTPRPPEVKVPAAIAKEKRKEQESKGPNFYSPTLRDRNLEHPHEIMDELRALKEKQNVADRVGDLADLRSLMRMALQMSSDVEILNVLQVAKREEMPEAIKTLQRALEDIIEAESESSASSTTVAPPSTTPASGTEFRAVSESPTEVVNPSAPVAEVQAKEGRGALLKKSKTLTSKIQRRLSSRTSSPVTPISEVPPSPSSTTGNGKGMEKKSPGFLKRSKTVLSTAAPPSLQSSGDTGSNSRSGSGSVPSSGSPKDTLDREFIESGIDALRRMSRPAGRDEELEDPWGGKGLPSWTITRYEVDREQKIGVGFFSDVYRGRWRGKGVAIKVLADTTPRRLFIREIEIWKTLKHKNVLELFGASSASGDPPWFFVSPYLRRGNLSEFLRNVESKYPAHLLPSLPSVGTAGRSQGHRTSASLSALEFPSQNGELPTSSTSATVSSHGAPAAGRGRGMSLGAATPNSGSLRKEIASRGNVSSPGHTASASMSASLSSSNGDLAYVDTNPKQRERETDLLRFMHEIAKGMEYLHSRGVLHGDLKASNVLVDDQIRCVISDFGQSEMKSEAYRISGTPPPHGTLRWQAPELMLGSIELTTEMDVYSFGITCVEILSLGKAPWGLHNDDAVRHFVLDDRIRPPIPPTKVNSPELQKTLRACWDVDPSVRPMFSRVAREFRVIRSIAANGGSDPAASEDAPQSPRLEWYEEHHSRPSPDMKPIPLSSSSPPRDSVLGSSPRTESTFHTARDTTPSPFGTVSSSGQYQETVKDERYRHGFRPSTADSHDTSLFASTNTEFSEEDAAIILADWEGYDSPPPADDRVRQIRDERRYRMLLTHEFHPSLTLPLWTPGKLNLGAVGYLEKPSGRFVTLMNALYPERSPEEIISNLPSIYGYGKVTTGSQRVDKRNAAQRGLDTLAGLLTFKNTNSSRRISFPLRSGHKHAYLCTESTIYRYMEDLSAPKKWFTANVDSVLATFGGLHNLQREDLFLIIGALEAPEYALFVSHHHPDSQVHFNVFTSPRNGGPWGEFKKDTVSDIAGPQYNETPTKHVDNSKVSGSKGGGQWDAVVLSRLRFKPDVLEPTSL